MTSREWRRERVRARFIGVQKQRKSSGCPRFPFGYRWLPGRARRTVMKRREPLVDRPSRLKKLKTRSSRSAAMILLEGIETLITFAGLLPKGTGLTVRK